MKTMNQKEQDQKPMRDSDPVKRPTHYTRGRIEVIEYLTDQGFARGFNRGNAIKYISRAGLKDPSKEVEDLEKAVVYLQFEIARVQAELEGRPFENPMRKAAPGPEKPGPELDPWSEGWDLGYSQGYRAAAAQIRLQLYRDLPLKGMVNAAAVRNQALTIAGREQETFPADAEAKTDEQTPAKA